VNEKEKAAIKAQILQNLNDYGIYWNDIEEKLECEDFRSTQLKLSKQTNPDPEKYLQYVQPFIATSSEINIHKIQPFLVVVESNRTIHQRLWAYASSFWSVPITVGFGRRIRYFVFDKHNNKLIGIIGLCDPIIGLSVRDIDSIGWSKDIKENNLYNCMTAYILGAIPPYNAALGSKLVALMLLLPEVRKHFYHKYKLSASIKRKKPYLAHIDTFGAFGKSSVYNRLLGWDFVGYTKGQSHLHITANGSWDLIKQVIPEGVFNKYKFGDGPNWKIRVLKYGLQQLDFSQDMLSIGWRRGYYRLPLAINWRNYLLNETSRIVYTNYTKKDLVNYWKTRWVLPRKERIQARLDQIQ